MVLVHAFVSRPGTSGLVPANGVHQWQPTARRIDPPSTLVMPSMFSQRIGSDFLDPDGVTVIEEGVAGEYWVEVEPCPLGTLWAWKVTERVSGADHSRWFAVPDQALVEYADLLENYQVDPNTLDPTEESSPAWVADLAAHEADTTAVHGIANTANLLTTSTGAGGVLSGTLPNPGFAVDMVEQSELDADVAALVDGGGPTEAVLDARFSTPGYLRSAVVADGVTDDTAVALAEIAALIAGGGGTLLYPEGTIRTTAPLTSGDNLTLQGTGSGATLIHNTVSDIFSWSGTQSTIRDLGLRASAGHIFKQLGTTTRCRFENLYIDQQNDAKSVYSHIADAGNYLFNQWSHVTPYHTLAATVPTFHFVVSSSAGAANANTWKDMDPTRSGNYVFHFESKRAANYVYDNVLHTIRYERPDGGCVKLLGTNGMKIEDNAVYDLVTPTRDMFHIGRGTHATSPASNRGLELNVFFIAPVTGVLPIKFQPIDGGVSPALETHLYGVRSGVGPVTVDFGGNTAVLATDCEITSVNGNRVNRVTNSGVNLPPGGYISGGSGATGLAADAAGGTQTSGPFDAGLGAQQMLNSEFSGDIGQWTDASGVASYSATGKMRLNNTSGTFVNVTGTAQAAFSGGTIHKVVLKLASVTAFPVPTTSLRLYDGSTYQVIANSTAEQVFYQTLGTGGLVLRTGDGLNVEVDYIRAYPVTNANVNAHGDVIVPVVGKGFRIKEGTNARMGVSTLVAGTVTVANTTVTASSRIDLTAQSLGTVTDPKALAVTARTPGTSFTIRSADATDTSVVAWEIKEPA